MRMKLLVLCLVFALNVQLLLADNQLTGKDFLRCFVMFFCLGRVTLPPQPFGPLVIALFSNILNSQNPGYKFAQKIL